MLDAAGQSAVSAQQGGEAGSALDGPGRARADWRGKLSGLHYFISAGKQVITLCNEICIFKVAMRVADGRIGAGWGWG